MLFRAPIVLYRLGLGGLLGGRFTLLTHILADPRVRVQVGWRRYAGLARPLPAEESGRRLADYASRHPPTAAWLLRALGQEVDGSEAAYRRVGSDCEHGVPLVALTPGDGAAATTAGPPRPAG